MFFDKDRIVKLMQSNQIASPLSFKMDSPRIYSKTPNSQSTLNCDLTSRGKLKLNFLAELSDNRSLTNRYMLNTKNKPKQQKQLFSKENKFVESSLKKSQLYPSTDSLLQNINIQSPASTFSEEFMKINSKFNSVKNIDNVDQRLQRKQSNSVIQLVNKNGSQIEGYQNNSVMRSTEKIRQQFDEIALLDLKSQNIYLQQENASLKSQLQSVQDNMKHQNKVIENNLYSKIKDRFNIQLKEKNEKSASTIEKLNSQLDFEGSIQDDLRKKMNEKQQELSKYNLIEQEIKKIEDSHLETLSKISKELKEQQVSLKILNHHISCLSQISILLSEKEEIPIEILFKYKQIPQIPQFMLNSEIIENILKSNSKMIKELYDLIGKSFEKISYNFVQEFSQILYKQ
ncbi:unnamed protein product (macronuclear) [Paramecium tetraurelia]|uniref:Uncharacterized protein n=1 Tax=Paramecium tetraurelia TaxID=5888 RepID=A0EC84_PARTE|nr:uncharacterized protein GSPATT00025637001 [Paramecium tetraurelia]CAK92901.1 unnamed protein product [Paramecium tetraurelia]|eukprot:XP_001460298.1 hypothetical protein (macronuclear) [Paramecium tetraurelia strain d4-2]